MAALLRSGRPSRMCGEWWLCAHHTTCYCRARALPCLAAGSTMRAGMAFAFAPPTHFLTLHGPPASHAPVPHIAGRSITPYFFIRYLFAVGLHVFVCFVCCLFVFVV